MGAAEGELVGWSPIGEYRETILGGVAVTAAVWAPQPKAAQMQTTMRAHPKTPTQLADVDLEKEHSKSIVKA